MSGQTFARQVRAWLLQQPKPAMVRITDANDGQQEIETPPGQTSWARVGESIEALEPVLVEALNDKGKLIRALRVNPEDDEQEPPPSARPTYASPPPTHVPYVVPGAAGADPETARLVAFAGLISEAYRHSTETAFARMSEMNATAFARMVDLFERVNERAATSERVSLETMQALRDAYVENINTRSEAAEEVIAAREAVAAAAGSNPSGDLLTDIVGAFAGGINASKPAPEPPASNGKTTNGHAHPKAQV
jgi:hypothetical protein